MQFKTYANWLSSHKNKNSIAENIIDLRSEKEFALGHIPGAKNIPLLDNEERHQVGLCYKTQGSQLAIQMGIEIFAKKSSNFIEQCEYLSSPTRKLTVYCWRGGMRSRSVATLLSSIGIEVQVIDGGYKAYRQFVLKELIQLSAHPLLVLNGRTGSGKTQIIEALKKQGIPAIDLEQIAKHRGSAFGEFGQKEPSPTQQNFENQLVQNYLEIKTKGRILLELEGNIGPVSICKNLRTAMTKAPMVYLEREFNDRVDHISESYAKNWQEKDTEMFLSRLQMLKKYLAKKEYDEIVENIKLSNIPFVVAKLLQVRYDKAYDKSLYRHQKQVLATYNMSQQIKHAEEGIKNLLNSPNPFSSTL